MGATLHSLMAMLCLLGLTGMGEDSPGRTDSVGTPNEIDRDFVEVSFCYWANYKDNEYLVEVCADFERKNPGIKIRREWYVGDYGRKLQLTLISDTAADIILMDDELYPAYAVRGYLEDLRPYILRKNDDIEREFAADLEYMETPETQRDPNFNRVFYPTALQSFNYRGFQGALPWDGNIVLMFYNKDLFDQEGIPYPTRNWTWAEFRAIAKKLTKDLNGDGRSEQFGTNMFFELLSFEPLLWSFGGEVLNKEGTRSRIQEPPGIEAAQFMYDIKYKDRSIAYTGEMENFLTEVQLLTGRVGMVPGGSYMIPMLNRVHDAMHWDVADMPVGPYGDQHTRVTWDGISINAHVAQEKKEIAWRFIKHLVSNDAQVFLGSTQRGLPIRHADALQYYVDPNTPAHEEIAIEACDYAKLTPVTPRFLELRDATLVEFDSLNNAEFSGITPEVALPRIGAKINKVLDKELADWTEQMEAKAGRAAPRGTGFKALGMALLIVSGVFAGLMMIPPMRRGFRDRLAEAKHMFRGRKSRIEAIEGILFASPWLAGVCLFTAFPILFSIALSFSAWDPYEPISTMKFIGLDNFRKAFSSDPVVGDPLVLKSLYNTFFYAFFTVPLGISLSLGLAILLNQKIRGITIFRTAFYLPSIVAGVATVVLWTYIFNPVVGPLNGFIRMANQFFDKTVLLAFINLPEPLWLSDPQWAKPALILMALWGAGGAGMLIFLAGLQGVPDQLYEVAELDGAGRFRKFWNITLPMLTPTIYFNLIMGVIGSLKVFMQAFIMTNGTGGVDKSLLFFVLHLYNKAFIEYEMGYAAALAWILFSIILVFTLLIIRSSTVWVYYEGGQKD